MSISSTFKSLLIPFINESSTKLSDDKEAEPLINFLQNRENAVSLARNFGAPNGGTSEIQTVVHGLNDLLKSNSIKTFDNIVNSLNPEGEFFRETTNSIKRAVGVFIKNLVDYMNSPEAMLRKITGDYSNEKKPIYQIVA